MLFSSLRFTWPKHLNLIFLNLCSRFSTPPLLLTSSLVILSCHLNLENLIFNKYFVLFLIYCSCHFCSVHLMYTDVWFGGINKLYYLFSICLQCFQEVTSIGCGHGFTIIASEKNHSSQLMIAGKYGVIGHDLFVKRSKMHSLSSQGVQKLKRQTVSLLQWDCWRGGHFVTGKNFYQFLSSFLLRIDSAQILILPGRGWGPAGAFVLEPWNLSQKSND